MGPPFDIPAHHLPILQPQSLDFGQVPIQTSDSLQFLLLNGGGTLIEIETVSVDCSAFWVSAPGTLWIWPGDTLVLQTAFHPLSVGPYEALLRFDLELGEDLTVPLSGIGVAQAIPPLSIPAKHDLIRVFPNPFNDELRILFDSNNPPSKLTILDCSGRRIEEAQFEPITGLIEGWRWKPTDLPAGLYFIEARTPQYRLVEKVIYLK